MEEGSESEQISRSAPHETESGAHDPANQNRSSANSIKYQEVTDWKADTSIVDAANGIIDLAGDNQEAPLLLEHWCRLVTLSCQADGCVVISIHQAVDAGESQVARLAHFIPKLAPNSALPSWVTIAFSGFKNLTHDRIHLLELEDHQGLVMLAPLQKGNEQKFAMVYFRKKASREILAHRERIIQLCCSSLSLLNFRVQASQKIKMSSRLQKALEIFSDIEQSQNFKEMGLRLCNGLKVHIGAEQIAIARIKPDGAKVLFLSDSENFARTSPDIRLMEAAANECADQDRETIYPWPDAHVMGIYRALEEYATQRKAGQAICIPMHHQDNVSFVIIVELAGNKHLNQDQFNLLRLSSELFTSRLENYWHADRFFLSRWKDEAQKKLKWFWGPRYTLLKLIAAGSLAALILSASISTRFEINAPTAVEGINSFSYAAPIDSFLIEAIPRHGDYIGKGDILGRLDDNLLQMQLSQVESNIRIQQSTAYQSLQRGEETKAVLAQLEGQKARLEADRVRERIALSTIRADASGYLVSEDLHLRIGQPIKQGELLFEIIDIDSIRLNMHVSEENINYLSKASKLEEIKGSFMLIAYPGVEIEFQLERIHPFAKVVDGVNGFDVWAKLGSLPEGINLKPGMDGVAHIHIGEESYLHIWTYKLIERMRLFFWQWL